MNSQANFDDNKRLIYPIFGRTQNNSDRELVLHDRLQYFSHQVNYIAALHSNGKISAQQANEMLSNHWSFVNSFPEK